MITGPEDTAEDTVWCLPGLLQILEITQIRSSFRLLKCIVDGRVSLLQVDHIEGLVYIQCHIYRIGGSGLGQRVV
jgi:hypothetical protein